MSRTALTLGLLLFPAPLAGQPVIAVDDADLLGAIARREALESRGARLPDADCVQSTEEEIVVCATESGPGFRVPYRPQAGTPPRLAPGELPRATPYIQDCHRLCLQPVGVTIDVGRLLRNPGGTLRDMLRGR